MEGRKLQETIEVVMQLYVTVREKQCCQDASPYNEDQQVDTAVSGSWTGILENANQLVRT